MSIKPPSRCITCARPVPQGDGFHITLKGRDGRRHMAWCERCAPDDPLHEAVADAEAQWSRATTPEGLRAGEDAMVQAYHRVVEALEDRHGPRTAALIYQGITR